MDTRLDMATLGLSPGDAHIIRNAGGFVSADVLRSIAISQTYLRTRRILLVAHTDCGALQTDQVSFSDRLTRKVGHRAPWEVDQASSPAEALQAGRRTIKECPFLAHRVVDLAVYDVERQVLQAYP